MIIQVLNDDHASAFLTLRLFGLRESPASFGSSYEEVNPETASFKAGRLMLEEIDECVDAGHSFAFETTLSGSAYLKKIALWQSHGYQVKLLFWSLPNEDIAVSRVARRVLQGGHNIPEDVIRRRFKTGLANFHERYSKVVDSWAFYDSSGIHPKLIDWSNK